MTVSTLNRRSFFQKLTAREQSPETVSSVFGKVKTLVPPIKQELPLVPPPTTTITINGGLEPYTGPWDYEQVAHLLRRTSFGLKKADLDLLLGMTMDAAVDHVLDVPTNPGPNDLPPPPVNNYYNGNASDPDGYDDPNVADGADWTTANFDGDAEGYRIESFRGWWYNLMLNQSASIWEKMTLFWHNHFATQTQAVFYGKVNYIDRKSVV